MFNHAFFVREIGLEHNNKQIVSDMSEGVIRNPFAFYFTIQRGFSGPILTLPPESYYFKESYFEGICLMVR